MTQRKEKRTLTLPWGLGEGMCSPLRVGEWLPPPQHGYVQRELGENCALGVGESPELLGAPQCVQGK